MSQGGRRCQRQFRSLRLQRCRAPVRRGRPQSDERGHRRLRGCADLVVVKALLERAATTMCDLSGLERFMVFQREGGVLRAAATVFADHDEWARDCQALSASTRYATDSIRMPVDEVDRDILASSQRCGGRSWNGRFSSSTCNCSKEPPNSWPALQVACCAGWAATFHCLNPISPPRQSPRGRVAAKWLGSDSSRIRGLAADDQRRK
jgi:hypothetical protein